MSKWKDKTVPNLGWDCSYIEDVGSDDMETCEMCESSQIRYVHTVTHESYGELRVGCVCGGRMCGDEETSLKNEKNLKILIKDKDKLLNKKWRISKNGNDYIKLGDLLFTVFYKKGHYHYSLNSGNHTTFSDYKSYYHTKDDAKLAGIDKILGWKHRQYKPTINDFPRLTI